MTTRREFLKFLPLQFMKGFESLAPTKPQAPKVARLDVSRCLAWGGASCQLCYLACPHRDKALRIDDQKPVFDSAFCNGCAMCDLACQTINDTPAIKMI